MYFYVYTVFIRCLKQGNHHTYGYVRGVYTALAISTCIRCLHNVVSTGKIPYERLCVCVCVCVSE